MRRKWGLDIDQTIADFNIGMPAFVAAVTGRNLFKPGHPITPPEGWSKLLRQIGYTQDEVAAVWAHQASDASAEFWLRMPGTPDLEIFNSYLPEIVHDDIYFITARRGGKAVTEQWLWGKTGIFNPTVLRAREKGIVARALGLDVFVDDRLDLALDVRLESPSTHVYLLDTPHNAYEPIDGIHRIHTLKEMFDHELGADELDVLEVVQ